MGDGNCFKLKVKSEKLKDNEKTIGFGRAAAYDRDCYGYKTGGTARLG